MTIRTRLTLWYGIVLAVSLLLISGGAFRELHEQLRHDHRVRSEEHALGETSELVFQVGLPAVILGLIGGWWLTRRTLVPLASLTRAAERIDERTLSEPLPRSGNGDELDRLSEVLNDMNARRNESFTRIREFTVHASHELKTPLTVLCGEVETRLADEKLSGEDRDFFVSQLEEFRRLSRIVDSLTLLAKADSGIVHLESGPLRFNDLVKDSFADAQILAEPQAISVELASCAELTIRGDSHRVRQMLLNLVDNAIKYNHPQGWVIMALQQREQMAEFTIANSGPGIRAEVLPRVFDRFYRGDPAHSDSMEGCGLGLSISQWIVSAHHGTIRITSEPGERTTVTVRLPLCQQAAAAPEQE